MPDREPLAAFDAGDSEAFWRDYLNDPFAVRGPHAVNGTCVVRTFQPGAEAVELIEPDTGAGTAMRSVGGGFLAGALSSRVSYRLRVHWPGAIQETEDPYSFGFVLGESDLYLSPRARTAISRTNSERFRHRSTAFRAFPSPYGRRPRAVFPSSVASTARMASVIRCGSPRSRRVGDLRSAAGHGRAIQYQIVAADGTVLPQRADPIARATEHPPNTASIVAPLVGFAWSDDAWLHTESRGRRPKRRSPSTNYTPAHGNAPAARRPERSTGTGCARNSFPTSASSASPTSATADHGASVYRLLGLPAPIAIRAERALRHGGGLRPLRRCLP